MSRNCKLVSWIFDFKSHYVAVSCNCHFVSDFIFLICEFVSHNCNFISHKWDFNGTVSQDCDFVSLNCDLYPTNGTLFLILNFTSTFFIFYSEGKIGFHSYLNDCWVILLCCKHLCSILEIQMCICVCNLLATCVQLDHNLKHFSAPYFSHENAQESASTAGWRKEQPRTWEFRYYIWLLVHGEVKFNMVVQGHSASHLDPSLNAQAKFQHPFKLILIISSKQRGSEVYTDLRSPLIHDYEV